MFYDNLSTTNYRIYPLTHTSFYRREGHSQGRRIKRNRVDKVGVRAARKTKKTTEGKKGKRCLWFIWCTTGWNQGLCFSLRFTGRPPVSTWILIDMKKSVCAANLAEKLPLVWYYYAGTPAFNRAKLAWLWCCSDTQRAGTVTVKFTNRDCSQDRAPGLFFHHLKWKTHY